MPGWRVVSESSLTTDNCLLTTIKLLLLRGTGRAKAQGDSRRKVIGVGYVHGVATEFQRSSDFGQFSNRADGVDAPTRSARRAKGYDHIKNLAVSPNAKRGSGTTRAGGPASFQIAAGIGRPVPLGEEQGAEGDARSSFGQAGLLESPALANPAFL